MEGGRLSRPESQSGDGSVLALAPFATLAVGLLGGRVYASGGVAFRWSPDST